ncbi:magnesium transporter [Vibrio sp. ZSDZ65]|uniref:Magnesium transporter n=1 Tax=Vibrio qingdaonensis TaxID=2829491 RepID=A0A9X3CM36_9VIBR|nr:magnesium transporter [Vibrio qingdaonensis]MCW8345654.1 magnesium transporter [Vibrio qingdaonensis]
MTTSLAPPNAETVFNRLLIGFDHNNPMMIQKCIAEANSTDLPAIFRRFSESQRTIFWIALSAQDAQLGAGLLDHLTDAEQTALFVQLPTESAKELLQYMRSSDRRTLLNLLPNTSRHSLETSLPRTWETEEKAAMIYQGDSVGRICKNEILKLEESATVADLEHLLREAESRSEHIEWRYIYLHDNNGNYLGAIKTRELFLQQSWSSLSNHIDTSVPTVSPDLDLMSLKSILDTTSHTTIPVVNDKGFQIGIVGFNQLNHALYEQSEQHLLEKSGIFGGDEFRTMPIIKRNVRRMTFLLPSVVLSYAAVSIIAAYEPIIEQIAVLAAILPLVANLSGAAGNQSVAISIRELSVGHISAQDWLFVVVKELPIGLINGFCLGMIIALLMLVTHGTQNSLLPVIVGFSYTISSTFAVILGGTLPLILKRINLDPAMLSSPILTTLTDAISFFSVLYFTQTFLL